MTPLRVYQAQGVPGVFRDSLRGQWDIEDRPCQPWIVTNEGQTGGCDGLCGARTNLGMILGGSHFEI